MIDPKDLKDVWTNLETRLNLQDRRLDMFDKSIALLSKDNEAAKEYRAEIKSEIEKLDAKIERQSWVMAVIAILLAANLVATVFSILR